MLKKGQTATLDYSKHTIHRYKKTLIGAKRKRRQVIWSNRCKKNNAMFGKTFGQHQST